MRLLLDPGGVTTGAGAGRGSLERRSGAPNMAVSCVWPSSILRAFLQGCLLVTSAVDPHAILRAARYYCRYGLRKFLGAVSSQERPYSVESSASECHHKLKVWQGSRRVTVRHGLAEGTGSKGGGTARTDWLGSSHRRTRGLVSSQNVGGARGALASQKKSKKRSTTMRFELTRFWRVLPLLQRKWTATSHISLQG